MQSKSESRNQHEPHQDRHSVQAYAVHSETAPWWRTIGYNTVSLALAGGNMSNISSSEDPNGSLSNNDQSMSNGRMNEDDDDASKESQATASSQSDHRNLQHVAPSVTALRDEGLISPQLELVAHSIACASYPYQDPYYGGMMAPYGHQPLKDKRKASNGKIAKDSGYNGYPHFVGTHQARMPLPNEIAQEPVYVNAKQYPGILRRRQARAKAELEKKLIKVRKPYLHESRHRHAMRRARGSGGRFAKKTEADDTKNASKNDSGTAPSSHSGRSSGSEPVSTETADMWIFSHSQQEVRVSKMHDSFEAGNHVNGGRRYQDKMGLQASSTHHSNSGEKGEDGDCSGQQRGSISSNQTSQRTVAIQ